jgi:hypothetical protein
MAVRLAWMLGGRPAARWLAHMQVQKEAPWQQETVHWSQERQRHGQATIEL